MDVSSGDVAEVVRDLDSVEMELRRLAGGSSDPTIKLMIRTLRTLVRAMKRAIKGGKP